MNFSKPILAIESSCDETAVAILKSSGELLASLVASQMEIHARFGGVVPEVASRNHLSVIRSLFHQALLEAKIESQDLGAVVATAGPGLAPALLVGASFAKGIALGRNIPYLAVNHLEGHLLSPFFGSENIPRHLGLLVSGGHTQLTEVTRAGKYRLLGSTTDDAAGEAFDKIAKLLGLPYPGGIQIDRLAKKGDPHRYPFPKAFLEKGNLNFSFSGLKTSVRYFLEKEKFTEQKLESSLPDICASVQEAIVGVLVEKVCRAAEQYQFDIIGVSGGVACNSVLQVQLQECCQKKGWELYFPPTALVTDNAAMIAFAALHHLKNGEESSITQEIVPQWNVSSHFMKYPN